MDASLALRRRFFADEIETCGNLKSAALVDALAEVSREAFLPPGPWLLKSEADMGAPARATPDADPRRVYHNVAVAIDPARMLFNGTPSLVGRMIDALGVTRGSRVLHVGCGTGYYTALLGTVVGPGGRVVAIDVDAGLAGGARGNLASMPWIDVQVGDGSAPLAEPFDAMLINAGVTHPLDPWLDVLVDGGRIVLPITISMPGMSPISKGPVVLATKHGRTFSAHCLTFVAIYSAQGIRDDALNGAIGAALQKNPMPRLRTLSRERHEQTGDCWLHTERFCLGL